METVMTPLGFAAICVVCLTILLCVKLFCKNRNDAVKDFEEKRQRGKS